MNPALEAKLRNIPASPGVYIYKGDAGVTIYVAASDLVPEVNKEPGARMALLVFVGVGLVFLLDHFFHAH